MRVAWLLPFTTLLACGPPEQTVEVTPGAERLIGEQCFWGVTPAGSYLPLTKIVHELRIDEQSDRVDVAIIFNRDFVDLTFGANAIGWDDAKKGHTFKQLTGSDHTELSLLNGKGEVAMQAKIDLLSESADAASGYRSLGVEGGDGKLVSGDADYVLAAGSSLDDNFNRLGYRLTEDSPETDASYSPDPAYPDWEFFVIYRLSVALDAFGASGFGTARMEMVHASPSKLGENSVTVEEDDCPTPGDGNDPFCPEGECATPGEPDPGQSCRSETSCGSAQAVPDL